VCVYTPLSDFSPLCLLPQIKIRDALHKHYFKVRHLDDDNLNPHSTICEWGKAIKSDFDTTNAPLKLRHSQPDQAQVAQAFTLLHNLTKEALAAQGGMLTQQGQQLMRQDKKIEKLQDTVLEMRTLISDLHAELSCLVARVEHRQPHRVLFSLRLPRQVIDLLTLSPLLLLLPLRLLHHPLHPRLQTG
jgi:uncharacterized coiled-coil protein SlyX